MQNPTCVASREFTNKNSDKKINIWEHKYQLCYEKGTEREQREAGVEWIAYMDSREFQNRLLHGTLPDFVRDEPAKKKSKPNSCENYPLSLMTEEDHESHAYHRGFLKRMELRYRSLEDFKKIYYEIHLFHLFHL